MQNPIFHSFYMSDHQTSVSPYSFFSLLGQGLKPNRHSLLSVKGDSSRL